MSMKYYGQGSYTDLLFFVRKAALAMAQDNTHGKDTFGAA